jgi:uncharacterized repeat protein (TIGR01451 family)
MRHVILGIAGIAIVAATSASAQAQQSDLFVEQTAPEQADADTDVTFSVTVTNFGPDASDVVTLSDPLPPGMTFVSADTDAAWLCTLPVVGTNGVIDCTLASLDLGAPASFSIVAHIDAATPDGTYFSNVASVATATDPNSENDSAVATVQTPPPPAADVGVSVQGPEGTNPDLDVVYAIEVVNGGPEAATNVALGTTIPGDMVFVSLVQDSGPAFSCTTGAAIDCTLATLDAGASATFTLTGHIPSGTLDGATYQLFLYVSSGYDTNTENDQSPTLVCVQQDRCAAGSCNADQAVVCPVPDQCHDASTCDPVSGACAPNPPKLDGTSCDDADACTQTDECQAGLCTGTDPVVCTVADQCEDQGTCDPATGVCGANTDVSDGTPCDDGDACTQTDDCQTGTCTGANPVVCPAADQCEDQGTCNPATGSCGANTDASDGTSCDDRDDCTRADACHSGTCEGRLRLACVDVDAGSDVDAGEEPGSSTRDAGAAGASAAGTGAVGTGAAGMGAAGMSSTPDVDAGRAEDAGADAGAVTHTGGGGCGCRVGQRSSPSAAASIALALCVAGLNGWRRRRRTRRV